MYWPTLRELVIKDVTVKQVTLNVITDMDKIDIVSSQAVLKMSSFSMHTLDVFLATG